MTPLNADAQYDADASAAVGYTSRRRSSNGPESTDPHPGIAPGAQATEAPASPSISTASHDYFAAYERHRRAPDPAYAQRSREQSLAAKRRRRGVCEVCGGATAYNGKTVRGASR